MKLVIDLPDEVVKWFKEKGFIPIGQYLMVDEAMKKAEPLSEGEYIKKEDAIKKAYPTTYKDEWYFSKTERMITEEDLNGLPTYSFPDLSEVLAKIKAEIKELRDSWEKDCYHDEAEALNIALKIIDKHIGKAESEG